MIFAKRSLVRICVEAGWPFRRWTEFIEIDAWLGESWPPGARTRAASPGRAAGPFFCGPEAWGEGLVDPPPSGWQE